MIKYEKNKKAMTITNKTKDKEYSNQVMLIQINQDGKNVYLKHA